MLLSTVASAAKVDPPSGSAAKVDPTLNSIDPQIETVMKDPEGSINPAGDFFRVILNDSSCIHIQKVNVRVPNPPKILETRSYCSFTRGSKEYSLAPDRHQDAEFSEMKWKNHILNFDLSYVNAAPGEPRMELQCTLDPDKSGTQFQCITSPDALI